MSRYNRYIDINCDLGESFGQFRIGNDEALLPYISSANIACGFHAGDPATMHQTVKAAIRHGVAIGAHPGYPDLSGFGRRHMDLTADEIYQLIVYQLGALQGFAQLHGERLHHIKPHGALYNRAARDAEIAAAIVSAVRDYDPDLVLYGLYGSELVRAGLHAGLRLAKEAFADRTYQPDGTLTPRHHPDAVIHDSERAAEQVINIIKYHKVRCTSGQEIPIEADTICIHGDETQSPALVRQLRERLQAEGIMIQRCGYDGATS